MVPLSEGFCGRYADQGEQGWERLGLNVKVLSPKDCTRRNGFYMQYTISISFLMKWHAALVALAVLTGFHQNTPITPLTPLIANNRAFTKCIFASLTVNACKMEIFN